VLTRLRRKYGADETAVLDYLARAKERAAELDALEEGLAGAEARVAAANDEARSLAEKLSAARRAAAAALAPAVEARLASLALEGARFEAAFEPAELYEGGLEQVDYVVSFNAGEELRPLRKVASGGELSRLALALALAGSHGSARTMIFDEVDAGVGGAAARSVGAALAELAGATGRQVMMVTHLPQVAAFADAHYRVEKLTVEGRTAASIEQVEGAERVAELSRMLAGMPGSERARGHAEELLEHAALARRAEPAARS
jgi:DNA repair protein RecN (Recombination protein N)